MVNHDEIELMDPATGGNGSRDANAQGTPNSSQDQPFTDISTQQHDDIPHSTLHTPVVDEELVTQQLKEEIDPGLLDAVDDPQDTSTHNDDGEEGDGKKKKKDDKAKDKKETKTVAFSEMWRYSTNWDGFMLFWAVVGALVNGFAMPLFSLLLGDITDDIQSGNMDGINDVSLLFVYIGIAGGIAGFLSIGLFMYSGERQGKRVREEYLKSILSQDITWHDTVSAGDLASKITAYTRRFQDGIGDKLALVIQNSAGLFFALGLSLYKGWELTLILLCPAPVLIIFSALMSAAMTESVSNEQDEYAQANVVAQESLDAIRTVHSNQMELGLIQRYNQSLQYAYEQGVKKMRSMGLAMGSFYLVIFCVYALGLFYGGILIRRDAERWPGLSKYTGGAVIGIFYALLSGVMMMGHVGPHMSTVISGRVAAYELFSVIDRKSEINPLIRHTKAMVNREHVTGRIHFVNVSFRYPTRPESLVLDRFTHLFESGQMTALCGGSGCGKSTIIQLIERFYDPIDGDIFIEMYVEDLGAPSAGTSSPAPASASATSGGSDGNSNDDNNQQQQQQHQHQQQHNGRPTRWVNLKDLDIGSWRRAIGLVSQEPVLWSGSIIDNIRYGKADATQEEVERVAKAANAHNFIMKKRDQYNSPVGENGSLLSGGEKQRVSIARALIMEPTILIFDEATSALDNHSEKLVQNTIDQLVNSGKYTAITIAHRLSTIRAAKTILCMSDGQIVEAGSHDELVEKRGMYYSMLNAQMPSDGDGNGDGDGDGDTTTTTTTTPPTSPSSTLLDTPPITSDDGDGDDGQTHDEPSPSMSGATTTAIVEAEHGNAITTCTVAHIDTTAATAAATTTPQPKQTDQIEKTTTTKHTHQDTHHDDNTSKNDDNTDDPSSSSSGQQRRQDFLRFAKFTIKNQWKWIVLSTIGAAGVGAVFPLYSYFMAYAIRAFYYTDHSEMKSSIGRYAGYFVALGVAACLASCAQMTFIGVAGERILRLFRYNVYDSVIRQDLAFHDDPKNSSSIITTKLAADTVYIRQLLTEFFSSVTSVFITVLASFIVGFTLSWKMTLVMMLVFPVLTSVGMIQMKVVSGFGSKSKENLEAAGLVASESVRNIRTVASFHGELNVHRKFCVLLEEALNIGRRSAMLAGGGFGITQLAMYCSYAFIFWLGGKLVSDGHLEFETMLQVFLMVEMASMMASQVFTQAIHVERASAAITDIYKLIDRVPVRDILDLTGSRPAITKGAIEFRNVHFHYPTRKDLPILKGVSFKAEPKNPEDGFVIAIVGESGGGKSTMFGLIQRFYDTIQPNGDERYHIDHPEGSVAITMPEGDHMGNKQKKDDPNTATTTTTTNGSGGHNDNDHDHEMKMYEPRNPVLAGEVFIDGYNINEMNLSHLRQYIGVVEQEPKLFKGTIRENILAGNPTVTEDEMISAARMANIHELIMRLPKQYDTVIDSKKVSGGQKQRIAIARSLVRKPKLLLLDEAVSALDNKSMMLVQDALNKAMKGRTTLVIAHRLETIKSADKIVVLSDGVIAEEGTHDELVAKNGVYAHLVGVSAIQSSMDHQKGVDHVEHPLVDENNIDEKKNNIVGDDDHRDSTHNGDNVNDDVSPAGADNDSASDIQ